MIRLRPLKKSDREEIARWIPEERQFAMWCGGKFEYPLTVVQLENHAAWMEENNAFAMAALDDAGELVGHFMIREVDYKKGSAHMGFIVVDPEKRGRGYGKEMVTKAVQYAFEILGLRRVTLNVVEQNSAAYACYRSIGFQEEKRTENAYTYKGEGWAICLMAIEKAAVKNE